MAYEAHTFAIGTLGVAVAAREIAGTIEVIGAGAGIAMPFLPLPIEYRSLFYCMLFFALAAIAHFVIRWMFSQQFGLAANAIRDDEDKAEAMGIPTLRYKLVGWSVAAFFMGCTGAVFGNMVGYIEPLEVAFPVATFGIFMVAMSLLGGKGTLGAGSWCDFVPYRQRNDMDLFAGFAMGRSWPDINCQHRVFPAGNNGMVAS